MSSDSTPVNNAAAAGSDDKVRVGNLVFNLNDADLKHIHDKIGDIIEAQVILRGSAALGFAGVTFKSEQDAATTGGDDIQGRASLKKSNRAKKARSAKKGGRARRSADEEHDEPAATSEEAAQNGQVSIKAVVDGLSADAAANSSAPAGETRKQKEASKKQAQKEKLAARTAARKAAAAEKRENSTPSKTLVFIRGIPFSLSQEAFESVLKAHGVPFSSVSLPVWKGGFRAGQGRGYAFASVASEDEQKKAIEAIDGKEINAQGGQPTAEDKKEDENAAAATTEEEGDKPAGDKKKRRQRLTYKLAARPAYEDEDKGEKNGGGPDDSGVAENVEVQGSATQAEPIAA